MEPSSPQAAQPAVTRHRGLVARAVLVSSLTLLSRLLGLAREVMMAAVFGERSVISDAFITAWRFPNLFRRLLGEGALATALQTAMTKADIERGDTAGRAVFLSTLRVMAVILLVVSVAGMLVMWVLPDQMPVTGWPWLGEDPEPVRSLTIRLLPYVVFVCLAALCGGALAVRGHFAFPSLAPAAMNLIWIGALMGIGYHWSWGRDVSSDQGERIATQWEMARWLSWALLLGGVVQLALHVPPLRRYGLVGSVGDERANPWHVLRATAPLVVGAAIYQINVMIDGLMAEGLLRTGGPSALYYANRVQQFPLALISIAAINAVFPALNAHGHLGERGRVRSLHDRTQLGILFLALPAATGLFALALPIASVCYEHGNYGLDGTLRVADGLRYLALALAPAGAAALASRVFVAVGDLRTPVRIALASLAVNVVLNVTCVVGLGMDVSGLTLSTAITTWINLGWLVRSMRTKLGLPSGDPTIPSRVARMALAALVSALVAYGVQRLVAPGGAAGRGSIPGLLAGIASSCVAYALMARALGIPEYAEVARRVRARLGPKA